MNYPGTYPATIDANSTSPPPPVLEEESDDAADLVHVRQQRSYAVGGLMVQETPNPQVPSLRFKVGRMEKRDAVYPNYDGNRQIGERHSTDLVPTFHMLGFGETLEKAEAMARRTHH